MTAHPIFVRCLPVLFAILLFACAGNTGAPVFHITPSSPDIQVHSEFRNNTVVLDISGGNGIGSARIMQTAGATPEQIILHLHLRALEHFKFSFGDQSVEIEIPTTGDHTPRESVTHDSPLYMPVRIISSENAYPIQEGYIQIELPRAYFETGAREFSIEWIDFYR